VIGLYTEQNPGELGDRDQCGVALGEEVSKWTGGHNRKWGVEKEGPELDTIWSNIPRGQFREDCTQLATKDWDNRSSTGYYGKNGGATTTVGNVGPGQNLMDHQSNKVANENTDHTSSEGTTPQPHQ
jgi:hypothetical protein